MIFILFGVLIGVFVEQTYSFPNIKDSISTCVKRKKYGEDNTQEPLNTKYNEHDEHNEHNDHAKNQSELATETEETREPKGETKEETENHID
tara:strand:- start:1374 stop:1649 length:276 start_codon:yes stop_codon:yes gene_type:complete